MRAPRAGLMTLLALAPAAGWRAAALAGGGHAAARAAGRRLGASALSRGRLARPSMVASASSASSVRASAGAELAPCPLLAAAGEEMPKTYEHALVEEPLYTWWEASGFFQPSERAQCAADGSDPEDDTFTIAMPPPNVTGGLHMGHAMFVALQDILTRFNRMRGKRTLWLPGTDHAGIATQMLVDRALRAEGISREEIGRDAFIDKVWEWKRAKGGYITQQIRRLGASCDWSREKFTLDADMSAAVTEAFVRLHDKGLVYKGDYLCNWSPELQTAVSDLEVIYSEEPGQLYTFKYPLVPPDGTDGGPDADFIPVATTRPETILGDTAVCVHPDDPRYTRLVGRRVRVPFTDRSIPVIADAYVDMEFGTGALKITPAHDVNDYELGKRHGLPLLNIMRKDATLNEAAGRYEGLDRYVARAQLWADLQEAGLAISVEDKLQRVPRSERSGEVIEPLVSSQWFVRAKPLAEPALAQVRSGGVRIIPERFEKVYFNWLDNINDWCISRQLWWGHRIPVWYARAPDGSERAFVARDEGAARAQAEAALGTGVALEQDRDVLDTWFSSGLWPFSTLGWPEQSSDLARFYPTQLMETGYDILFFWVARMIMLGIELTGQPPFHTVYMHGLVRDDKGAKMSKTKGNVIDPLDSIAQYGTDALRYTLVTGSTPGQDIPLSTERLLTNRNLCNKLWNTGRFLLTTSLAGLPDAQLHELRVTKPMGADELARLSLAERYIVSRAHALVSSVTQQLDAYSLGAAGTDIARFLWDEYADWYIEASKTRFQGEAASRASGGEGAEATAETARAAAEARRTLVYVLDCGLRLLHPFMPYVTEAIWQRMPHDGPSLMLAPWPLGRGAPPLPVDAGALDAFGVFQDTVRAVRNARAEYKVEPGKKIHAVVCVSDPSKLAELRSEAAAFALLARVDPERLVWSSAMCAPAGAGKAVHLVVADGVEVFLPLANLVDADKETARLEKQAAKLQASIDKLAARLGSPGFADKAPADVVALATAELAEQREQLETIRKSIADLVPSS